jgi:curved DNA-binding protein CbpA
MGPDRTHYDVLGVAPQATLEEIRAAYHDRARAVHPDVGGADRRSVGEDDIRSVNEAWRVLGHADTRAEYDLGLRPEAPVSDPGDGGEEWVDRDEQDPDRVDDNAPMFMTDSLLLAAVLRGWPILLLALVAAIFVFSAYAGGDQTPSRSPGGSADETDWEPGDCLIRLPEPSEVPCGQPHDAVVAAVLADEGGCAAGAGWIEADVSGPVRLCIVYDR